MLNSSRVSEGSVSQQSRQGLARLPRSSETASASGCSKNTGRMSIDAERSETSPIKTMGQLPLFPEAIHVLSEAEQGAMAQVNTPTFPVISLPWSEDCGPGGWSAKMFLHQMMSTLRPHWTCSDTERLLCARMPIRLQVKTGSGISLSEVLKKPGKASPKAYTLPTTLIGLLRRATARGKSFRVLLRTEQDTIPAIVMFGTDDCESWTLKSASPLLDSLKDGLMDYLRQQWRALQEMR